MTRLGVNRHGHRAAQQAANAAICVLIALLLTMGQAGSDTGDAVESFDGYDELVERAMSEWEVPGVALAVVKGGEIAYMKGYGFRDSVGGAEVTTETLFPICSITKTFTAMSVGLLVDDGKLAWDTPVREYLPGFKLYDEYASQHATLRDLLSHRTGLGGHYGFELMTDFTNEEKLVRLRHLKPVAGFREKRVYSNQMYKILGMVVRQISGTSWDQFVTERVFKPLGMTNTFASRNFLKDMQNVALPHDPRNDENPTLKAIFYPERFSEGQSAGGIVSNVEDMSKWLLLHLNGAKIAGEPRGANQDEQFISTSSLVRMHGPEIGHRYPSYAYAWGNEKFEYATSLGWDLGIYRGHDVVRHSGANPGFTTHAVFAPSDNVGVVVLTNHVEGYRVIDVAMNEALDRVLALPDIDWFDRIVEYANRGNGSSGDVEEEDEPAVEPPTLPLASYAGSYAHPAYGRYTISYDGESLSARFNHIETGDLTHIGGDRFSSPLRLMPITEFVIDSSGGAVAAISAQWAAGEALVFNRVSS